MNNRFLLAESAIYGWEPVITEKECIEFLLYWERIKINDAAILGWNLVDRIIKHLPYPSNKIALTLEFESED